MRYKFVDESWEDYLYWQKTDKKILSKINDLLKDISRTPFSGLGKPEPLRYDLSGLWSRRLSQKDRLIYRFDDERIYIFAIGGRYEQ